RRPPPPITLFPYTTLFRSPGRAGLDTPTNEVFSHCGHSASDRGAHRWSSAFRRFLSPLEFRLQAVPVRMKIPPEGGTPAKSRETDRKSTRLNSSHLGISYA